MPEIENAVVVDFPLRGEWMAPNTPGKKIPSHGTNQLGQRYAIDLLQVDWEKSGMHFFNTSKSLSPVIRRSAFIYLARCRI